MIAGSAGVRNPIDLDYARVDVETQKSSQCLCENSRDNVHAFRLESVHRH